MDHKAYILRTCNADMSSRNGFVWPREGVVECPDWKPTTWCGNGLHGALWGEGDGALLSWEADAVWVVAGVDEWIDLNGKVKFPRADVVFAGPRDEAVAEIIKRGAKGAVIGGTASAGDDGTASAGYRGTASAGDGGTATAGDDGTASAGDDGTLCLSHWDGKRRRIVIAYVGEDGVKPNTAYRLRDGKLVEA